MRITLSPPRINNRWIARPNSTVRVPGVSSLQAAGFGGVALLVLVTSGVLVAPVVVIALGLTGMGLLVLAWLGLGHHSSRISVKRIYWIGASWCLPLLAARPLFSGDVRSYLAQGVIAARGMDPYVLGPAAALGPSAPLTEQVSVYWRDTPAPYGAAFVALSRAVAQLAGGNLVASVLLFRLIALVGIVLIAWALPRLARRMGVEAGVALWLGVLNPLVLWHLVAGAHNDALMIGLVLAGMEIAFSAGPRGRAAAWARIGAAVVLLTVAANIKIVATVALCCLGAELARQWGGKIRHCIVVALSLLAVSAAISVAIAVGTGLGFGWIHAMGASSAVHSWLAPTNELGFLIGTFGRLAGLNLTSSAITMTTLVGAAIGAVIGVRLLWATVAGRLHPLRALALIFAAMVVVGPVVQPWYLLWTVACFAAIARTGREVQVLAGVSALFAVLVPPVLGRPAELVGGYLVAALLVGGAVLIWQAPWSHPMTPVPPSDEGAEELSVPVLTVTPRTPPG